MSEEDPIRLFVTHTFSEHPDYFRVFEYLESASNFFYVNCSSLDDRPETGGRDAVKEQLRKQISEAEVVIVLSSMYAGNKDWITYEMDTAQALDQPLVVLEPFGVVEEVPDELKARAAEVQGWNERLIVDALRRQARHEETTRWDTIEFDMP